MNATQSARRVHAAKPVFNPSSFLPFLIAILVLTSVYIAGQRSTPNDSIFDVDYGFGPVIQGIVQQHRLGSINHNYGFWSYAHRMPASPLLSTASYWLSPKASVFFLLKNVVFWSLFVFAFFRLKSHYAIPSKWALVPILLLLLAPYDLSIAGRMDIEEGYLFALIAMLFSFLLTMKGWGSALTVGILIGLIYLTKSSMLPLCVAVTVWIAVKFWRKNARLIVLPVVCLALAILSWGGYTKAVSGVFAFGTDQSSWNGWNFYKGNNFYSYSLYLRINLDTLDSEDYAHKLLPYVPVHNEWELSHAQLAMGKKYFHENPGAVVKMNLTKLFVACCDLGEAPQMTPGHTRGLVVVSNVVNHLTLAAVFLFAIIGVIRRKAGEAEVLAVIMTLFFVFPYIAGFLYSRHMVPVYGLMALTAAVQLTRWQNQKEAFMNRGGSPRQAPNPV